MIPRLSYYGVKGEKMLCSTCGRDCGIPPYRERNTCPEWRAYAANVKLLEKIRGMG